MAKALCGVLLRHIFLEVHVSDKADPEIKSAFNKYYKTGLSSDLRAAVACLNYHYSTHLSNDEMDSLCRVLSLDDFTKAKSGNIDEFVNKVLLNCQDKRNRNNFSFATKLAYFATDEKSPIFDKYVGIAIEKRGYTGGRDFKRFQAFMMSLSKKLGMSYHNLDDFLISEGKPLEANQVYSKKARLTPTRTNGKREMVVNWWKKNLEIGKRYETNQLYHKDDTSRSIYPSDHCYNKTNIADIRGGFPNNGHELLFWCDGYGVYTYKGPNAKVTGKVVWTDKDGVETNIGEWKSGNYESIKQC
jgi:hypothetical protein